MFLRSDASRYQNDLDLKLQGIVYYYVKSKPEILWTWSLKSLMTEDWHWPQFVQCGSMLSHLQCAALWKWCAVLHPMGIPSLCHCYLGLNVCFLLMPSLLLCTGCHSINHSSLFELLKHHVSEFFPRPAESDMVGVWAGILDFKNF